MTENLPGYFTTDLTVMDDPKRQQYVLMLRGREVTRVEYAEVFEARRRHPQMSDVESLVAEAIGFRSVA